jgi:hypothetical protein
MFIFALSTQSAPVQTAKAFEQGSVNGRSQSAARRGPTTHQGSLGAQYDTQHVVEFKEQVEYDWQRSTETRVAQSGSSVELMRVMRMNRLPAQFWHSTAFCNVPVRGVFSRRAAITWCLPKG